MTRKKNSGKAHLRVVVLCAVGLAALSLVILAGCGLVGEEWTQIEWYSVYFEKYYPRWMEKFERDHADENVRIRFRAMVGGTEQMVYTMLISHTLPDCIGIGPQTSALLLENPVLEPLAEEDFDVSSVPQLSIRLASQADGALVGYPHQLNMRPFIYFNRQAFREAGTSASEVPETFDEYRKWASRLFKWRIGDEIFVGPPPEGRMDEAEMLRRPIGMIRGFPWSAIPLTTSYMDPMGDEDGTSDGSVDDFYGGPPSGRPFRFDTPEFKRGLREYRDLYLPKDTAVADGDANRVRGFKEGIYAGAEGSNWIYGEVFTIDMQITRLPHAKGRKRRVWMYSSAIGVSKESRHKKLAKEFAAFITRPHSQIDAYYGHGYLPASFKAWEMLRRNDSQDKEIRKRFLETPEIESGRYVGVPAIKRVNHESMEVYLYVPHPSDQNILTARRPAAGGETEPAVSVTEGVPEKAAAYRGTARELAVKIGEFTGLDVRVTVQGTPEEMIPARSFVIESPVPVYADLLDDGIYVPVGKTWNRLQSEVISRVCQFVTRAQEPMSVDEAAEWAQREAQDIVAGRK